MERRGVGIGYFVDKAVNNAAERLAVAGASSHAMDKQEYGKVVWRSTVGWRVQSKIVEVLCAREVQRIKALGNHNTSSSALASPSMLSSSWSSSCASLPPVG